MFKQYNENNYWISFSDLMTGLMIIFLFIAINYIVQVVEYRFISQEIYNKLEQVFSNEINDSTIHLSPDGVVSFRPKANQLHFNSGDYNLTKDFKDALDVFIPRYIEIITNDDYIDFISEIRIEGHTDPNPPKNLNRFKDSYLYNIWLSSERAAAVLTYVRASPEYISLPAHKKERLDFLFTANGLSFSRALNSSGEIVYLSNDTNINNDLSRRVEFKIVTSNEKLIENIINFNEQ